MIETLADKTCTPCRGGIPPLTHEEAERFRSQASDWELRDEAGAFVQEIGELAEAEGHHPDISFGWGYATVGLQTKKIKGLHENDFIMATKIDQIFDRSTKSPSR
jgi:4a-hydroxytetrahydrobiopterin dehydratase